MSILTKLELFLIAFTTSLLKFLVSEIENLSKNPPVLNVIKTSCASIFNAKIADCFTCSINLLPLQINCLI